MAAARPGVPRGQVLVAHAQRQTQKGKRSVPFTPQRRSQKSDNIWGGGGAPKYTSFPKIEYLFSLFDYVQCPKIFKIINTPWQKATSARRSARGGEGGGGERTGHMPHALLVSSSHKRVIVIFKYIISR